MGIVHQWDETISGRIFFFLHIESEQISHKIQLISFHICYKTRNMFYN